MVQCNVMRSHFKCSTGSKNNVYLPLNAGGGRASALTGGSTTPTGVQSSIKNFFGKEVSKSICNWSAFYVGFVPVHGTEVMFQGPPRLGKTLLKSPGGK